MATLNNDYNPTAANILSSLSIRGASTTSGTEQEQKVPVLNDKGKLDLSVIPLDEIAASIDIPALANTAYVDPRAGEENLNLYNPTGSIGAPYRSLEEAASAGFSNFVLISDNATHYKTSSPVFNTSETIIRVFSTGTVRFTSLNLNGYLPGTTFIFNNISVDSYLRFNASYSCRALITGIGSITTVQGMVDDPSDPEVSTKYLTEVAIDDKFSITNIQYAQKVTYLATSAQITNASTVVSGTTVKDATDRLGNRRIRVPKFSTDSTGIHVSDTEDIQVTSGTTYDYHNITSAGESLVSVVNSTFYKEGDSPEFNNVEAVAVEATKVETANVATDKVTLGDIPVFIDSDNFLTVGTVESSSSNS